MVRSLKCGQAVLDLGIDVSEYSQKAFDRPGLCIMSSFATSAGKWSAPQLPGIMALVVKIHAVSPGLGGIHWPEFLTLESQSSLNTLLRL